MPLANGEVFHEGLCRLITFYTVSRYLIWSKGEKVELSNRPLFFAWFSLSTAPVEYPFFGPVSTDALLVSRDALAVHCGNSTKKIRIVQVQAQSW